MFVLLEVKDFYLVTYQLKIRYKIQVRDFHSCRKIAATHLQTIQNERSKCSMMAVHTDQLSGFKSCRNKSCHSVGILQKGVA